MAISQNDVKKVALLARLELTDAEIESLTSELDQIVSYVDQLAEVDTDDVEPMAHAVEVHNVFADDIVRPSLSREQALENAPNHNGQGYLVPPVLGD